MTPPTQVDLEPLEKLAALAKAEADEPEDGRGNVSTVARIAYADALEAAFPLLADAIRSLRARVGAERDAALEEAAKVCEKHSGEVGRFVEMKGRVGAFFAMAIRALKNGKDRPMAEEKETCGWFDIPGPLDDPGETERCGKPAAHFNCSLDGVPVCVDHRCRCSNGEPKPVEKRRPTYAALADENARLREALETVLLAPMTAPESCFNPSHEAEMEPGCPECEEESLAHEAVRYALDKARAALARTEGKT